MKKEVIEELLHRDGMTLEKITSFGDKSPDGFWYEDCRAEWVMVVKGVGEIDFEDGEHVRLCSGEYYLIESMRRHRVSYTSNDCVWIALYH